MPRTTERERAHDGSFTISELDRRDAKWLDGLAVTTRCDLDGCDWVYEGTFKEGREKAREHREQKHPGVEKQRREERIRAEKARVAEVAARRARAHGAAPRPAEPARRKRWTYESAFAAMQAFLEREGHPPATSDLVNCADLPSPPTVKNLFGSVGDAVVLLGWPRPTRATVYKRRSRETVEATIPPVRALEPPAAASPSELGTAATTAVDARSAVLNLLAAIHELVDVFLPERRP
jgi:hypothetical protein